MYNNIWQTEFRDNLNRILKLLSENDPTLKIVLLIVLLKEAVNTIKYPGLEAPFNKASQIIEEISKSRKNIYCLDVHRAIIDARKQGKRVWQTPSVDPLSFKERG